MENLLNIVSRKGSSLLEVLMALALLGVTMASLLSLYAASEEFYDHLFPLDLFSVRDCIENTNSMSSTLYLSYTDEKGWVSSDVSDDKACCVATYKAYSSTLLGDYELVSVFTFDSHSGKTSSSAILTYLR
jgi:hypothetical protein